MRLVYTLILCCLTWIITSCDHKGLIFPGATELYVKFDWENASGAEVDGMSVYFFPVASNSKTKIWRFDIAGRDGGKIDIPPGNYSVIAVNNDLPGINFSNTTSFSHFTAQARPSLNDTITRSTGMLYGAAIPLVDTYHRTITLYPDSMATVYNIIADSIQRADRIRAAKAVLYGVALSKNISTAVNSAQECAMETTLQMSDDSRDVYVGTGCGFGTPKVDQPKFILKIIATTSHATYSKNFDVTDQVKNNLNQRNVTIHISGLEIPAVDPNKPTEGGDVNINVGVDGWQLVEITYS